MKTFIDLRNTAAALTLTAAMAAASLTGCRKDDASAIRYHLTAEVTASGYWDKATVTAVCVSDIPVDGRCTRYCLADTLPDFSSPDRSRLTVDLKKSTPTKFVCIGQVPAYKNRSVRYYVKPLVSEGSAYVKTVGEGEAVFFDAPADSSFDVSFTVSDLMPTSATITAHFTRIISGRQLKGEILLFNDEFLICPIPPDFLDSVFVAKFDNLKPNSTYRVSLSENYHPSPWADQKRITFTTLNTGYISCGFRHLTIVQE